MLWWLHVNNAITYAGGNAAGLNPGEKILLMHPVNVWRSLFILKCRYS